MIKPFTLHTVNEKVSLEINLEHFFLAWAIFTCSALSLILALSCINTFDCSDFLPTISYLAAYTYYDRPLTLIAAAQSVPLTFFFISTFVSYQKFLSRVDSITLLVIGVGLSLVLPGVLVFDEVNSSYFLPLDRLHVIILSAVLMALGIWVGFSIEWLYKMRKENPGGGFGKVGGYLVLCFVSVCLAGEKWKSAEGPEDYSGLAVREYVCVGLLSFLPWVYLRALSGTRVSIGKSKLTKIEE